MRKIITSILSKYIDSHLSAFLVCPFGRHIADVFISFCPGTRVEAGGRAVAEKL